MLNRRSLAKALISATGLAGLASCAGLSMPSVPVLRDVQTWVTLLAQELPEFINDSITTGLLTGASASTAEQTLVVFEKQCSKFISLSESALASATVSQTVSELLKLISTILAVIPATAPYSAMISAAVAVISAFLAATPIAQPAVPAKVELTRLHMMLRTPR